MGGTPTPTHPQNFSDQNFSTHSPPDLESLIINRLAVWHDDFSLMVEELFGVYRYDLWISLPDTLPYDHPLNPNSHPIPRSSIPHQEQWQSQALSDFHINPRLAIKSGKGVGKSTFLSWLTICFLITRQDAKIPCTAPTGHQLFDVLWSECKKWYSRILPPYSSIPIFDLTFTKDRITVTHRPDSFAVARTARKEKPEALQGYHAGNILVLVDEASGVDDEVYEVGEGAMSTHNAHTVLTGNPTRTSGYFYECFHSDRQRWHTRTVSGTDSSRVTTDYVDGMLLKWGIESNEYRIGVLGEFPLGNSAVIIPLYLAEAATQRHADNTTHIPPDTPTVWGVDVARFGDDRTALAKRQGRSLTESVLWWQGKDLMQTCGLIYDQYASLHPSDQPSLIIIDIIGLGAGVYDRLRELNLPVKPCNVATRSPATGFHRLRDWLWFQAREWLQDYNGAMLYPDDSLISELTSVEYEITSNGDKQVLNKHASGHSPDLADAFILTFYGNRIPTSLPQPQFRNPALATRPTLAYADNSADYMDDYY